MTSKNFWSWFWTAMLDGQGWLGRAATSDQRVEHPVRDPVGREQVGDDADQQRDREAADRARTVGVENDARDEVGDVRVEHRPERAREAGVDGRAHRFAEA